MRFKMSMIRHIAHIYIHVNTCIYMYVHVCKHVFTKDLDDEQRIVHVQIHVCTYIRKNTYTDDVNDTYKCD